jgi:cell division protein FtsN
MSLARTNIQERFPDNKPGENSNGGDLMAGSLGDRTGFGFDAANSNQEQFQAGWADPADDSFSTVSEEPNVSIEVLSDQPGQDGKPPADESGGTTGDETKPSDSTGKPAETDQNGGIFNLSDSPVFRIQVGTFGTEQNAESVWRRLTQAGYDAHISAFTDADGTKYKVHVGSYRSREDADKVAEDLRSMNFDAWVYEER